MSIFATAGPQPGTLIGTELAFEDLLMCEANEAPVTALQNEVVHDYCFNEVYGQHLP